MYRGRTVRLSSNWHGEEYWPIQFGEKTIYWPSSVRPNRAAIELNRNNPTKALVVLQATSPYEYGQLHLMYAVYLRGLANFRPGLGKDAAADFQDISCSPWHRSLRRAWCVGASRPRTCLRIAIRHGESARRVSGFSYVVERRRPRHPILIVAKSEYAKLE
jgi:hypothetical protein